ncbi:MAG: ComEC/Rec2 family competence protein, partial [Actinomycetes bacterium]
PPHHPAASDAGVVASVRARAERGLDPGLPADTAALLTGMALGDDSRMSKKTKNQFRRASLTHLVAASGQNIALMLALALPLLGMFGLSLRARLLVAVGLVAFYVPLAGGEAPIRRAAVMALATMAGKLRGRPADAWHALGLAGVITLLLDRSSSQSLGWQLSFVAVAGMLALGPPLQRGLTRLGCPDLIAEAVAATVSATVATTPVIAWKVGRLSLAAIPANLLAAPAVAPAMWLGLGGSAMAQVSQAVAAPFAYAAAVPVSCLLELAQLFGTPSWASLPWKPSGEAVLVMLGLLALGAGMLGRSRSEA